MRHFFLLLTFVLVGTNARAEAAAPSVAPIKKWISQQADVHTLAADFVQTRRLRVLRDPVARPGKFFFRAPGTFRWELGTPPETIALRRDDEMSLISVKAKKVTRTDLASLAEKSGMRDLPMMEFPMAASYEDFARRFEVRRVEIAGTRCDVEVMPRDARAQKYLKRLSFAFDTENGNLLLFEIVFRDGSEMRNEFSNVQVNRKLAPGTFDFDFAGYTITRGKN